MKKILVIFIVLALAIESKAYGKLMRATPAPVFQLIQTATPTPRPVIEPLAQAHETQAPPCVIDWTLAYTDDNARAILSCYKARQAAGLNDGPLCAPPDSTWDSHFNSSVCWAINHGTPAALTATAMPPTPTIDLPPTEVTPTPPAYP